MSETILQEAERIVDGPRQADYGTPQENHTRTAAIWTAQLSGKLKEPLTATDVCLLNIGQKLSRAAHRVTRDTLVDIAGFARNAELTEAVKGTTCNR